MTMHSLKPIKSVVIVGRRWFDKTYGNTYHTVTVEVNGKSLGRSAIEYGYGESFLQTAHAMLQTAGYYGKTGKSLSSGADADYYEFATDKMNHRNKFSIHVSDVSRKRDL